MERTDYHQYIHRTGRSERYTDGTRLLKWNLTYYVRNKNRTKAREYADKITAQLDGVEITDETSGVCIQTEAATLPRFKHVLFFCTVAELR